jgi:hypothetical protein
MSDDKPVIKIDRLALDLPGFDSADARALAREIGERLALSGVSGARPRLTVTIDAAGGDVSQLAQRIVAALRDRLI